MVKIELKAIDHTNMDAVVALEVSDSQKQYIDSNKASLEAAAENKNIAHPFAIYADDKLVGFTMFAFDVDYADPNDRLSTKDTNTVALSLYHKYQFKETGEMNGEEMILELKL